MNQFKIEKNIPIPSDRRSGKCKYPFGEMKIGDSFFIPTEAAAVTTLRSSASYYSTRHKGFKFSILTMKEPAGCRVWRV